ncbi:hypothetical protein Herbaro_08200 [Herbaspirillum sp. WKF16]|uniref:helix-turn-helix transcriptional regulator n=1 Tax=Herbaspirillum sp. WKF16 TaxID=3028312 RepID=UPI0023A93E1F|nr:hypothetical protein [Herbaspirillum sp. WKF16]WDZ97751.1 hypothetical protein Herbaro_08200 [Herbaspirillum sp. WKF16]
MQKGLQAMACSPFCMLALTTAFGMDTHTARSQRLQLIFQLTRAEAELAILISYRDISPQECAQGRGVSITTVRAQIQALFVTVGISRLPQLITTILQLG